MLQQMQAPGKLLSNLGLPASLAVQGKLPALATFVNPLMEAVPTVSPEAGRPVKVSVTEQKRLIREGIEAAYDKIKAGENIVGL